MVDSPFPIIELLQQNIPDFHFNMAELLKWKFNKLEEQMKIILHRLKSVSSAHSAHDIDLK